jgi:hypothetical protein
MAAAVIGSTTLIVGRNFIGAFPARCELRRCAIRFTEGLPNRLVPTMAEPWFETPFGSGRVAALIHRSGC